MRNTGRVVSKTMIIEHVWDYNFDPQTNVVEVRICRLRDKIDRPFKQPNSSTPSGASVMSLKKSHSLLKTTTFRLTLWYVLISALISSALFGVLYITLVTNLARRVDDDLREDVVELITHYRNEGLESITQEFTAETNEEGIGHAVFLLFSPNNELLAHSDLSMWNNAEADLPGIPSLTPGQTELTTVELRDRGRTRFITSKSDDGTTLRIGELLEEDQDLMETYRTTFANHTRRLRPL